jgi:hypothetical protein
LTPSSDAKFPDWWLLSQKRIHKDLRRGFDSFFILVAWLIWKEQDERVFQSQSMSVSRLISCIGDEGSVWVAAGFNFLSAML